MVVPDSSLEPRVDQSLFKFLVRLSLSEPRGHRGAKRTVVPKTVAVAKVKPSMEVIARIVFGNVHDADERG